MKKILLLIPVFLYSISVLAADKTLVLEKVKAPYKAGDSLRVTDQYGNLSSLSSAVVAVDPKNKYNLAIHVKSSGENLFVEIPLRNNQTAASITDGYDRMSLKLYRSAADGATRSCKFMIYLGNTRVYSDVSNVDQGNTGVWQDRTYKINRSYGSSNVIRLGLSATKGDYYIDDIVVVGVDYMYDYKDPTQTARYYADQVGKYIGVCVNPNMGDDRMAQTVYRNFNMVVCENAMKFDATEPSQNRFNYSGGDNVVAFAEKHGMKVRGHALCWHSQVPSWVSSNGASATNDKGWTKKQLLDILKNHIYNVAGHYKGKVVQWDVVNECLDDNQDGSPYKLRSNSVWLYVIGEEFIDSAFVWARQAAPDAELYLNDYNVGIWEGSWESGKTKAIYNLAKRLKDNGIPIDGVGLQTHTSVNNVNLTQISRTFDELKKIGLKCIITELDMKMSGSTESAQAEKYAGLVDIVTSHDNSSAIVVWGTDDNHSWLDDHETSRPLLFNPDFSAKPAYLAVVEAFKNYATTVGNMPIYEDISNQWSGELTVYNLLGVKIENCHSMDDVDDLPSGLYIINGRKYLKR